MSNFGIAPGSEGILNHASVLQRAADDSFVLWTTQQDGSAGFTDPIDKADWLLKKCSAMYLKKINAE